MTPQTIDPFFLKHFDVNPVPPGDYLLSPKTWEGRDFVRDYDGLTNAHETTADLVRIDRDFVLDCIIPAFIDDYRFNTRKHPKRGATTTHASVNI